MKKQVTLFIYNIYPLMLIIVLVVALVSCSQNNNSSSNTIKILYDVPEVIFAIELYRKQHPNKKIIPLEFSNYSQLSETDVLILSKTTLSNVPFPISSISLAYKTESTAVKKTFQNMQLLSFSFPLLIVKNTASQKLPSKTRISLSTLQEIARENTVLPSQALSTFGFIPEMSSFFDQLFDSKDAKNTWIQELYANYDEILALYHKSFSPVPYIAQLLHDNIVYKLVSSSFFFNLPQDVQENFDYIILTLDNGKIPITASTYIGIHNTTKQNKQAEHFINWILQSNTQIELLKKQKEFYPEKRLQRFFGNSLSSNWESNLNNIFAGDTWLWDNQPLMLQIDF